MEARLFHRVPHGAELTEAGMAFQAAVKALPDQVATAVVAAQRAARGQAGALRVGFTGSAAINPIVPGAIRAFRRRYPDVDLLMTESNSAELVSGLRDERIDIAFLRPGSTDLEDMHLVDFPYEPMVLALPSEHPVLSGAAQAPVRLSALKEALFVLPPRAVGPTLFDAAIEACERAGFSPRLGPTAPQLTPVLSLVAAEEGVSIVPVSMRQLALEGVTYRSIADAAPVARLALAHPRVSRSPLVRNFLVVARDQADQENRDARR